jgi:hypothetical protein
LEASVKKCSVLVALALFGACSIDANATLVVSGSLRSIEVTNGAQTASIAMSDLVLVFDSAVVGPDGPALDLLDGQQQVVIDIDSDFGLTVSPDFVLSGEEAKAPVNSVDVTLGEVAQVTVGAQSFTNTCLVMLAQGDIDNDGDVDHIVISIPKPQAALLSFATETFTMGEQLAPLFLISLDLTVLFDGVDFGTLQSVDNAGELTFSIDVDNNAAAIALVQQNVSIAGIFNSFQASLPF